MNGNIYKKNISVVSIAAVSKD